MQIIGRNQKIHAISADEVTPSNDEIMSICFRYVDGNLNIREVFIEFVALERITGDIKALCRKCA